MWTEEWPTSTGYYWFCGWCFKDRRYPPDIHLVRVRANGVSLVTDGHFLYKSEGGYGFWQPAALPKPPELSLWTERIDND